jgi:hypothetical protein
VDRQSRDKFTTVTQADVTGGNACLETPPAIYAKLLEDFGPFALDLTADAERHLSPLWLGPGSALASDALTAHWHHFGFTGYSNPPYGPFVPRILKKAKEEAAAGFASTFLLPMRVTKAFTAHVLWEHGAPKLTLTKKGTYEVTAALFDSILVRYVPGQRVTPPHVGSWKVPPHV